LNLVIVLDISGSMGCPFEYDSSSTSKMEVAKKAILDMLSLLNKHDYFGLVLFDHLAEVAWPLQRYADQSELRSKINAVSTRGGTELSLGNTFGTAEISKRIAKCYDKPHEWENRIIFLTDALPNRGEVTTHGLLRMISDNAINRIYSSIIGIGVDFDTELVNQILKVPGANYFSVHNQIEFTQRLVDDFRHMVTPLVFNLKLDFKSKHYRLARAFGTPNDKIAQNGSVLSIDTLFPSKKKGRFWKGRCCIIAALSIEGNKY